MGGHFGPSSSGGLGALSLGALLLGALPLGALPLGALLLGALPLGALLLGALPLGAKLCRIFKDSDLRIAVEANKKVTDFLDITLHTGSYKPYKKNERHQQLHPLPK